MFAWTGRVLSGAVMLVALQSVAARAQAPDAARVTLARRVLDASGTVETIAAAMRANLPAQRMANPQIPAEFWTRFEARIAQEMPLLLDSIAVLYAARFTQQELSGLLAFHQSPTGRRLRELQPSLVTESSAIGQRWGMRIGAEIGASLQRN